MQQVKNKTEIESMRKGGKILSDILDKLLQFTKIGVNLLAIEDEANRLMNVYGVQPAFLGYYGYQYATCLNLNSIVQHGTPFDRVIVEGDLLSIDCGIIFEGMYLDSTRCKLIEGLEQERVCEAYQTEKLLIDCAYSCMNVACEQIKNGQKLSKVIKKIESKIIEYEFQPIIEFCGHGVGYDLHEEPDIPNFWISSNDDMILKSGMTLAIEPMISSGSGYTESEGLLGLNARIVDDMKAVSYENTVLVLDDGCEILTN